MSGKGITWSANREMPMTVHLAIYVLHSAWQTWQFPADAISRINDNIVTNKGTVCMNPPSPPGGRVAKCMDRITTNGKCMATTSYINFLNGCMAGPCANVDLVCNPTNDVFVWQQISAVLLGGWLARFTIVRNPTTSAIHAPVCVWELTSTCI